ncbi:MAG: hypothetical protein ABL977_02330, partial [Candidatus Eisenbacteria bacterium]
MPLLSRPNLPVALILVLAAGLATRLWFLWAVPFCAEDAYITFRYAEHWAHGLGPVYNIGERAWGFTSPLWTTVLALGVRTGAPIEGFARTSLVLCDLASLVLVWRLLARHSPLAAIACSGFIALWPRLAHLPATGLETSLVTTLLLAAAALAESRAAGVWHGVLALSRPEGAAMSAVLAWRLGWRQRFVWLGVASLWAGFMLYFARPFPSSVGSKATVYGIQWFQGVYWLEWLLPGLTPRTHDGETLAPVAVLFAAGLIAVLAQWRRTPPVSHALPVLLASGLATLLGYMALGVPWYFWYAPTPMVAVLVAVFLGLAGTGVLRWAIAPLAVFVLLAGPGVAARVVRLQTHDAAVFTNIARTLRVDAAGREASVLLEPIGIVGHGSGLRVLDEVGLVTPWIAAERRAGDGWYARVLARERPDYLVVRRDWFDGGVAWAGIGAPFRSRAER